MNEKKSQDLERALKEAGIPFTVVTIPVTVRMRKMHREVAKFVKKIESAHKRAAHSKLHFGAQIA